MARMTAEGNKGSAVARLTVVRILYDDRKIHIIRNRECYQRRSIAGVIVRADGEFVDG